MRRRSIYAIAGPTASGKTALAVRLAKHVDGEIVNFDSVQIYRGIHVATAKPTEEERGGVPHHLIDYVDPNLTYTAVDWARDAGQKIYDIEGRGKTPILVGGTGFYLRTLREPLFESEKTDAGLRERLRSIGARRGAAHLHKMLARIDRHAAARIPINDTARVIRALEVYFHSGEPITAKQPDRTEKPEFAPRIRLFVLDPPRDELYARINSRTESHFSQGLVDEVKALRDQGVLETGSALGAHGYRRVCEFLRGERSLESAVEKTKQDVRNYAKRQWTWFRREPDAVWLQGFGDDEQTIVQLLKLLNAQ